MSAAARAACLAFALAGIGTGGLLGADLGALITNCLAARDQPTQDAAITACGAAITAARVVADARLGDLLSELGLAHEAAGQPDEARRAFEEALRAFTEQGDTEGVTIALGNLGVLAESLGDYDAALADFERAETLARAHAGEEWAWRRGAIARINQATVLEKLGDYRAAFERIAADLDVEADAGNTGLEAIERIGLWSNAGVLLRNLGDPGRALVLFDRALAAVSPLPEPALEANVRLNRGLTLSLDLDRPSEARPEYLAAVRLARAGGERGELVQTLFYLGLFELAEGHLAPARAALDEALVAATEARQAEGRWSALEGLGRLALRDGEPERADELFEQAIVEIEATRARVGNRVRRAGYFGDRRGAYDGALSSVLATQPLDEARRLRALRISEAARARDLLDALGDRNGRDARDSAIEIDLPTLRRLPHPTVAFSVADQRLWRFVILEGQPTIDDLGASTDVLRSAALFTAGLSSGDPSEPLAVFLGRRLLADLPERAHWIVVPDTGLADLAWDSLFVRPGVPWLDESSISLAPSVSAALAWTGAAARPLSTTGFWGFADLRPADTALPPLAASRGEVTAAARRLGLSAQFHFGADGTEAALAAASQAEVIHIAAHAVERLEGVALAFTPSGSDDGWLHAREIAGLRFRAALVLLSACRAGSETVDRRRAATRGLPGAFLAAGARGVVAPLWEVRDGDAAVVMDQLVARLARGEDPAVALRAVKRRLRDDPRWRSPERWAGWMVIGTPAPLPLERGSRWRRWVPWFLGTFAGTAIVAAARVLFLFSRRRKEFRSRS